MVSRKRAVRTELQTAVKAVAQIYLGRHTPETTAKQLNVAPLTVIKWMRKAGIGRNGYTSKAVQPRFTKLVRSSVKKLDPSVQLTTSNRLDSYVPGTVDPKEGRTAHASEEIRALRDEVASLKRKLNIAKTTIGFLFE